MVRASSREGASESEPRLWMRRIWSGEPSGVAGLGTPSEKTRTACLSSLARSAGGGVAADDVVVEDGFELPALGFGEAGEVAAAVEALLFSGDGDEDDGGWEFELREDAGALERDGDAAGVVVGSGSGVVGVEVVGVAGVVVAGDEDAAGGPGRDPFRAERRRYW